MNYLCLIGIDSYANPDHTQLNNCVKDVQDFRDLLLDKYDFEDSRLYELYNEDATSRKIQDALAGYIRLLDENSNLVIYFSGHGWYDTKTDRGFWVPHECSKDYTTFLANEVILGLIQKIKAKHIFLIVDSCFSWSILVRDLPKIASEYDDNPSRWALTSGKGISWDSITKGVNSVFGESLLKCLAKAKDDVRVGKLIEFVKNEMGSNPRQTPQGFPLLDANNKGGEFIFRISSQVESENQEKEFKVHKDALKILQLYNRNGKFKEMWRVAESKDKVGYVIFLEKNNVTKKDLFYLFLYQGINLSDTFKHINLNYPQIFKLNNLVVLLPKEKEQKNYERRIKNVSDNLKPLSIFYIDDFIRDECSANFFQDHETSTYLQITNFIFPSIRYYRNEGGSTEVLAGNLDSSTESLKTWFRKSSTPILMVKGSGGIGKTTIAKFISDKFIEANAKSKVIFIESKVIINKLNSQENPETDSISFYNLYEVSTSIEERLDKDVFKLNFDAGNILIVIDGLDEIIANVRKFKVNEFISSIERYTDEIHDGKVIITCRSFFWDGIKHSGHLIQSIEILPFNFDQANAFFKASFPDDDKKVKKCLEMADEFSFPVEDDIREFQPYALDVIRLIVTSNRELLHHDISFNSNLLEISNKRDYILFRICNREQERVNQISVDDQITFFIYFSLMNRGIIKVDNFKHELSAALERTLNDTTIEAFKGHPLLLKVDSNFKFKYDFFIDFFRNVYISSYIKIGSNYEKVSDTLIQVLAESCWFGSDMVDDIKNRMQNWADTDLLKIAELISQINADQNVREHLRHKAISGLFSIALSINHKFHANSIEENTTLLKVLFENPKQANEIVGLCIVNFLVGDETVRFDFSNLTINRCYINTYPSFWKCLFNESTFFLESTFQNIDPLDSPSALIPKSNFINPIWDEKFHIQFENEELKSKKVEENIVYLLKVFFRQFHTRGRIDKQPYERLETRFKTVNQKYFDFKSFIKILSSEGIIRTFSEQEHHKVDVLDKYRSDVSKFINDNSMPLIIQNIFDKLFKSIG